MRCHYEVLNVSRDADDAVLKTAYRKAALQWHPDKNQHRIDEADVKFKELQNAYEVLSDKHERAWYDSHRDAILRSGETHQAGGDGGVTPGQRPSDELDPFQYFSTACFSGYNDGAKGFYTVYSGVFQKLAEEERQAASSQGDAPPDAAFPPFGLSSLSGPEVATFYSVWLNFSTVKDFAWADKYNPASAPNRKVRRLMEEENKKERKGIKRSHSDAVRELVAFVRKRDKRLAAHQSNEAKKRMQREEEDKQRREQERQERLQRALQVEEAEWINQAGQEGSDEEQEPASIPDELYCPLCDKSFKSRNALVNHERSKQHQKAVEELRAELEEEEEVLDTSSMRPEADVSVTEADSSAEQDGLSDDLVEPLEAEADAESSPDSPYSAAKPTTGRKKSKKQKKRQKQQQAQMAVAAAGSDTESEVNAERRPAATTAVPSGNGSDSEAAEQEEDSEDAMLERMMRAANMETAAESSGSEHDAASIAGRYQVDDQNTDDSTVPDQESQQQQSDIEASQISSTAGDEAAAVPQQKALSHQQVKRLRRQKAKGGFVQPAKLQPNTAPPSTLCATCGMDCNSRNKLFAHLKSTGHAAFK